MRVRKNVPFPMPTADDTCMSVPKLRKHDWITSCRFWVSWLSIGIHRCNVNDTSACACTQRTVPLEACANSQSTRTINHSLSTVSSLGQSFVRNWETKLNTYTYISTICCFMHIDSKGLLLLCSRSLCFVAYLFTST